MQYYDTVSVIQVLGNIYKNPHILDYDDKYVFNAEDFVEEFHRILFGSIYNLYMLGAKEITPITIENYLEQRPTKFATYKLNEGSKYLEYLAENAQFSAFDYYYNRLKKMTLLRMYHKAGMDLKWLYDDSNILDVKKKQKQEEWLDNHSLIEVADEIDKKIEAVHLKYADGSDSPFLNAGEGALDLLNSLKESPAVGIPMYGKYINAVTMGLRKGKLYIRSGSTGVGKTRMMIADACYTACSEMYDIPQGKWVSIGESYPVTFIATEQDQQEVQTMMIAFLSGVPEDHILLNTYTATEWDRVCHAAKLLENSPIHLKLMPDFSLQEVESTIKFAIREYECDYVFFDYIHTSMKILAEIGKRSGVKNLREDNILFLMSVKLKEICVKYNVCIVSGTQLNGDYKSTAVYDQNLLRGAKSIADKVDMGMIALDTTEDEKKILAPLVEKLGCPMPNVKMSVYKNRRGRWKDVLLWMKAEKGICRFNTLFVTDYSFAPVQMQDLEIKVKGANNE